MYYEFVQTKTITFQNQETEVKLPSLVMVPVKPFSLLFHSNLNKVVEFLSK